MSASEPAHPQHQVLVEVLGRRADWAPMPAQEVPMWIERERAQMPTPAEAAGAGCNARKALMVAGASVTAAVTRRSGLVLFRLRGPMLRRAGAPHCAEMRRTRAVVLALTSSLTSV
jgi:hypothetical protein